MLISQKCYYAIRAVFELATHYEQEAPLPASAIARAQAVPVRFLEVILRELRQAGTVRSRRGASGGYLLAKPPHTITIGDVIGQFHGTVVPVSCAAGESDNGCQIHAVHDCVFMPFWQSVQQAITDVYEGTTFEDLVAEHRKRIENYVPNYAI